MNKNKYLTLSQAEKSLQYVETLLASHQAITSKLQLINIQTCIFNMFPEIAEKANLYKNYELFLETVSRSENDADPLIVLTIIQHFKLLGVDVSASNQLLEKMRKELSIQPERVRMLGRIRLLTKLLGEVGYSVKDVKTNKNEKSLVSNSSKWFNLPETELSNLVDMLIVEGEQICEQDSEILSLIAIAELRNYKVDLGCKLLRLVLSLGIVNKTTKEALQFIALQRSSKGSYGFLNPFKHQEIALQQLETDFHIPFMLNVMLLMLSVDLCSIVKKDKQYVGCA